MDHPPAPFFFSVNFPLVSGDREIGRAAGGSAAELRIKRVLSTADGTLTMAKLFNILKQTAFGERIA